MHASAWRSERTLATVRLLFCSVVLVRSLLVTAPSVARFALEMPALLSALGFSLYVLLRAQPSGSQGRTFFLFSAGFDAVTGFAVLLPMALWPERAWLPLLEKPDIAGLLLIVAASAFRHSLCVSALSFALNSASFLLLMRWDRAPWTTAEWNEALLHMILLCAMGGMAALLAQRTRRLVMTSATAALDADRAQRNLALVLREHHDLRSHLASATLNVDLAQRELTRAPAPQLQSFIDRVRQSLKQINGAVACIKERSYEELAHLEESRPADLACAASSVREELARRFPAVRLELRACLPSAAPCVAGGSDGLRRMLLNLATNACEGSGTRGASTIIVESGATATGEISIVVRDDGPGFSDPSLSADGRVRLSSKPDGFGLGLSLVRQIAETSGGRVQFTNDERGGARVELVLPAAPSRVTSVEPPRSPRRDT